MNIIYCDICLKQLGIYERRYKVSDEGYSYDLCAACHDDFKKWVRDAQKNKSVSDFTEGQA